MRFSAVVLSFIDSHFYVQSTHRSLSVFIQCALGKKSSGARARQHGDEERTGTRRFADKASR